MHNFCLKLIGDNHFYIVVDETTDNAGRYIAHLLIGILKDNVSNRSYLISSKQLEKTNNVTMSRFIQEGLSNFFLPEAVPLEKTLLLVSDAAPYMVRSAINLKVFYPNLLHVTCLAHGLNRVAEEIRNQFPMVNELISNVKKVFLKAPLRIQMYKDRLPDRPLPPRPVTTRWGTWLNAAIFYADHFAEIKTVVLEITDSSQCVTESQRLFNEKLLPQQLSFIKCNYDFVPTTILALENTSLSLIESVEYVDTFQQSCAKVQGNIGLTINKKCENVISKNTGYGMLKEAANILKGDFNERCNLSAETICRLKNAPITSVDVERTFSVYKHMFTDKRHNFLVENFEKYLVIKCFYNYKN